MNYLRLSFTADPSSRELLIAQLSELGYEGFEETEDELYAFIPENIFDKAETDRIASELNLSYAVEVIKPQNWNETWESNFEPVILDGFCTIRASFHKLPVLTPFEIVITPKMSFGTGHHATTQLVMQQMKSIEFNGKTVLDFGSGTGILSILAEMLGAEKVLAIDNDEWCYTNAVENAATNNCSKIVIKKGSLEQGSGEIYDIIIANINRHILLDNMEMMSKLLKVHGKLIMSGLFVEDKDVILQAAKSQGFRYLNSTESNNWIAILVDKI